MSVGVRQTRTTVTLPRSRDVHIPMMDQELTRLQAESLSRLRTAAMLVDFTNRKRARDQQVTQPPPQEGNEDDEERQDKKTATRDDEATGHERGKTRKLSEGLVVRRPTERRTQDPLIYPGLYAPSGFDMMSILVSVAMRPNAQLEIGCVDSSTALVLCDASLSDLPIVYCSEPFLSLTGYNESEVLGRNCRFLQTHDGAKTADHQNDRGLVQLKRDVASKECRVEVLNYRKTGESFVNLLTTVPIVLKGKKYVVGFQAAGR
ncbi:vivid PAS protein WD [Phlyctema vagabunda]|uniref:Vivid PAS protein WD n=1 Tax=Phlyctema vagabunda TaxID=108571 RepID=A0ABR4PDM3_9HELO